VCLSSRPSTCINATPTGRIFVKLYTGDFYANLPRNSMFGYNRTKISVTLHEDPSEFHIVGRDIHNATMQKTGYSVSTVTLNIYYIIYSDIYT
jgi:hypothetical protein